MKTAVDTNVLLAILYDDDYADTSESELRDAYRAGKVVVMPIVYAELAADGRFDDETALDQFLEDFSISPRTFSSAATPPSTRTRSSVSTRVSTGRTSPR